MISSTALRAPTSSPSSWAKAAALSPACTLASTSPPKRQNTASRLRHSAMNARPRSVVMSRSKASTCASSSRRNWPMRSKVCALASGVVTSIACRASSEMRNISTCMAAMRSDCGA
jgi:hypothetical protein